MREIEQLIEKCTKISLLLGMATGCLLELVRDERVPMFQKQPLIELLTRLSTGIDQIYYNKADEDE